MKNVEFKREKNLRIVPYTREPQRELKNRLKDKGAEGTKINNKNLLETRNLQFTE